MTIEQDVANLAQAVASGDEDHAKALAVKLGVGVLTDIRRIADSLQTMASPKPEAVNVTRDELVQIYTRWEVQNRTGGCEEVDDIFAHAEGSADAFLGFLQDVRRDGSTAVTFDSCGHVSGVAPAQA